MEEIFETAYIELIDARSYLSHPVTTARTKSILSGLSAERQRPFDVFKVQFNPGTLKLSGGSGKTSKGKKGLTSDDEGNTQDCEIPDSPGRLTLSVTLVFDRSIYVDSSVQPEVEGFLAVIKNPFTRKIAFHWGSLYFMGQLNSVSADYVMFNLLGIPMRAKVDISMEVFETGGGMGG